MRKRNNALNGNSLRFQDERPQARDFNSWHTMNPVQRDMAFMDGSFITQSHHILLLTLEEAQQVADDLMGGVDKFFLTALHPATSKMAWMASAVSLSLLPITIPHRSWSLISGQSALKPLNTKSVGKPISKLPGIPPCAGFLTEPATEQAIHRCWKWHWVNVGFITALEMASNIAFTSHLPGGQSN